jgi:hypothetical protein
MSNSRRYQLRFLFALASLALLAFALLPMQAPAASKASSAMPAKNEGTGRLIVKRSANLGSTIVGLSVDGKQVARINYNGTYDAPISAGPHVLTALPIPNREHADATTVKVNVQPGQTYNFTAYRDDVRIALR